MKKKFSLLLASIIALSSFVFPLNTYAASENSISSQSLVMFEESMYAENISGLISVSNYTKGIMHALPAANLKIKLEDNLPSGSTIRLNLENAQWFFRDVSNGSSPQYADEYYKDGIGSLIATNYDTIKGTYTPTSAGSKGGIYVRNAASGEVDYELVVSDVLPYSATLITKREGIAGDVVIVPLVVRIVEFGDARVSIESSTAISGTVHTFAFAPEASQQNVPEKSKVTTKTYVNTITAGKSVFPIDKLVIEEKITGSITSGAFEIIAPEGVKILPDIDDSLIKANDPNALNIKVNDENVVKAELSGYIKWTKGTEGKGFGKNGDDYTLTYRYPAGKINYSSVIVELKDIESSKRDELGTLTITGLKLVADETVPNGNINLQIKNYSGNGNYEPETFLAAKKSSVGTSIEEPTIKNTDLEHYPLETLIALNEFKSKSYITAANNMVEPEKDITRAEVCQMIYELFADKEKQYLSNFYDIPSDYANAIGFCSAKGFVAGYGGGEFMPYKTITRGEMATVIMNILKLPKAESTSVDLETGHWAYNAIAALVGKGIMSGYPDGSVKPDQLVTKAESVSMINRAFDRGEAHKSELPQYADINSGHWAYNYLMNALHGGN